MHTIINHLLFKHHSLTSKNRVITNQYFLWSYFRAQVISAMCLRCLVYSVCHLAIYICRKWGIFINKKSNHKTLRFLAFDDNHFIFLNKMEFQFKLFTSVNTVSATSRWIISLVIKPLPHHCTQGDTRRPTTEQNITYSQEGGTISQSSLFGKKICRE